MKPETKEYLKWLWHKDWHMMLTTLGLILTVIAVIVGIIMFSKGW